ANVTNAKLDKTNIPLSGFGAAAADVALGSNRLTGVADPASAQDAATKAYVDAKSLPTATTGDMLYYDGTAWTKLPAPNYNLASMQFSNGVPTWVEILPTVTSLTGRVWMDRNLGATQVATSSTDAAAYGDLYQWGRGTDGHQLRTSNTTTTKSSSNTPGNANFILTDADWRSTTNDLLWQGEYGINNPCPSGFRVPTKAEWEAERNSWVGAGSVGAFGSLKLTMAGRRDESPGTFASIGTWGGYWSSTINSTKADRISFDNNGWGLQEKPRAQGLSVRCIKD
uniref:hypothetical protein n=1 Tax=Shewanella sp. TaxID=50422 RepID=UPI00404783AC